MGRGLIAFLQRLFEGETPVAIYNISTAPNEYTEGASQTELDAAVTAAKDMFNGTLGDATVIDPITGMPVANPDYLDEAGYVRRVMSLAFLSWAKNLGIYVPE